MKQKKVLLAMSGGVDSSVSALLLKNQRYDIIAVFLKCYSDTKDIQGRCSWKNERDFALQICNKLNIPLKTLDYEKEYKSLVIDKMLNFYKKGITPNPDIDCNTKIKFPFLLKKAKELKCDFIATGHYARIKKENNICTLLRAKDESKDQSYFLYQLKEIQLQKIIFPIGETTKKEVREIAKNNNFINYDKKSTRGICFIGKINFNKFLKEKIKQKKGIIVNPENQKIGEHDGFYYLTLGQRIGPRFGIDIKKEQGQKINRWYVAKKNTKTNTIIAAPKDHPSLFHKEIFIKNFHTITKPKKYYQKKPIKITCRIRHVGELLPCTIEYKEKKYFLTLKEPISSISPGQAIVLYKNQEVLGGGIISFK